MQIAQRYNKFLTAFVPDRLADVSKDFDFNSIMLYDSTTGSEDGACESDINYCPMLEILRNSKAK
jgi:hypothetical protein